MYLSRYFQLGISLISHIHHALILRFTVIFQKSLRSWACFLKYFKAFLSTSTINNRYNCSIVPQFRRFLLLDFIPLFAIWRRNLGRFDENMGQILCQDWLLLMFRFISSFYLTGKVHFYSDIKAV